ncbi:hypothetical protein C7446_2325 [Kushneria sinocarnis]|uniref:Uncharacterized protein n=1 Tax=Kushneria sinocarnis TaxID=595502 RepID=A0A420WVM8_9GAMM|nr:hypothetical protein [Kushneria sinocarnis]RKR02607.1 hypothetical protein C7446_2325 [Kushneria sinocarnis]
MSSAILHEGARVAPVPVGWAAMLSASPSTQLTVLAGLLTCSYLILQGVMILRRMRADKRRLEMDVAEHEKRMQVIEGRRERER